MQYSLGLSVGMLALQWNTRPDLMLSLHARTSCRIIDLLHLLLTALRRDLCKRRRESSLPPELKPNTLTKRGPRRFARSAGSRLECFSNMF